MRRITASEVHGCLEWSALIEAMRTAHKTSKRPEIGDILLQQSGTSLLVRASMFGQNGIGLKAVTVFPQNPSQEPPLPTVQGEFLLFDEATGSVLAVIDGAAITPWKTAADSALGAAILARPDVKHMVMAGAGTMAQPLIEAHLSVRPSIEKISLWNRTKASAQALGERLGNLDRKIEIADDLESAIRDADLVCAATLSKTPFIQGSWIKAGAHIDLVGAFTPDMREADDEVFRRGRLFVDARETTIGHIGEIDMPLKSGVITVNNIEADLFDLCPGQDVNRLADDITIYKNGGGAHLDLITARHIYSSLNT